MRARAIRQIVMGLAAFAVVTTGAVNTASAKSVWAMLSDQNPATPNGVSYKTSTGDPVFAQADGYDSQGVYGCIARSYNNNIRTTSPCNTNEVTYQSFVRIVGTTLCSSTVNNWSGIITICVTPNIYVCPSNGSCTSGIYLQGWGRGI